MNDLLETIPWWFPTAFWALALLIGGTIFSGASVLFWRFLSQVIGAMVNNIGAYKVLEKELGYMQENHEKLEEKVDLNERTLKEQGKKQVHAINVVKTQAEKNGRGEDYERLLRTIKEAELVESDVDEKMKALVCSKRKPVQRATPQTRQPWLPKLHAVVLKAKDLLSPKR